MLTPPLGVSLPLQVCVGRREEKLQSPSQASGEGRFSVLGFSSRDEVTGPLTLFV